MITDLSLIENFVLHEADGDSLLWELAAGWTDNGTPTQRTEAVSTLREAIVALVGRGLVQVRESPSWPPGEQEVAVVTGERLDEALAEGENWQWRKGETRLISVYLTDAGVRYL